MLSNFSLSKDQREKLTAILRQQREPPCIQHIDLKCKKIKLSESTNDSKSTVRYVRSYGNYTVFSDALCHDYKIDFWDRESKKTQNCLPLIKQSILKMHKTQKEQDSKELQQFKQRLFVWFYQESLRPKPFTAQPTSKRIARPMITIKSDQKEGISVHGTITTKDGFKITYPNVMGIIKMSSLWDKNNPNVHIQRSFYPLKINNHLALKDELDDLTNHVWKIKQFYQFFKFLLKLSMGNLEIKEVLVKVSEKLKTTMNHCFLFYQISQKAFSLATLIKDLNKRGQLQKRRKEIMDFMMDKIKQDLDEILDQFSIIPLNQVFVNFKQYTIKLQQTVLKQLN